MGMIIPFVGPSGAGKTTAVRALLEADPTLQLIPSVTTRPARDSDVRGEYEYVHPLTFEGRKTFGQFLWDVKVHGFCYGTMYTSLDNALMGESPACMIVVPKVVPLISDYAGQENVRPFFLQSPGEQELRARLHRRGESSEMIEKRIQDCWEWEHDARKSGIPYVFISTEGKVEDAVQRIKEEVYRQQ